jgi:type II secretory pathway predicted ATPase ExeA
MYEKFFGLDELPFDGLPSSRFYYVGASQHDSLDLLSANLTRNGSICVLSGPSGCGKTTLVRMLIRSLPKNMRVIAIDDPRLDEHMLLATILRASGVVATSLESIPELTLKLRQFLERSVASGIVTTVILDEAQGLSDEVLEQVRLISNLEGDLGKMINFLLVGQEDLLKNLKKQQHQMLGGRIRAFAFLRPLKRDEVRAYISFRLLTAGCHEPIFTERAFNAIYKESSGLPRLINIIADRAMCLAAENEKKNISLRTVTKAIEVVRHKHHLLSRGFMSVMRFLGGMFIVKLPLICLGVALAFGSFLLGLYYFPQKFDTLAFEALLNRDKVIAQETDKIRTAMLPGLSKHNRDVLLFDNSLKNSVFRSDAIDLLIKLYGYARQDDTKADCRDLSSVKLKCITRQGSFDEMLTINHPAVLYLVDSELNPLYVVLKSYDDEKSEILIDDKLYLVKSSFLKKYYANEYTYIQRALAKDERFEELLGVNTYLNGLFKVREQLSLIYEIPILKDRDELRANFEKFQKTYGGLPTDLLIDRCIGKGPQLHD